MQIAIVGLARSGKTTVFNTLTRGHAETGGFGGLTVNTGVVKVPDDRLTQLTDALQAQARGARRRDLRRPAGAAPGRRWGDRRRHPGRPAGPAAHRRRAAPCRAGLQRPVGAPPRRVGRPLAGHRAAGAGVRARGPGRGREARGEAADQRPPRHALRSGSRTSASRRSWSASCRRSRQDGPSGTWSCRRTTRSASAASAS